MDSEVFKESSVSRRIKRIELCSPAFLRHVWVRAGLTADLLLHSVTGNDIAKFENQLEVNECNTCDNSDVRGAVRWSPVVILMWPPASQMTRTCCTKERILQERFLQQSFDAILFPPAS